MKRIKKHISVVLFIVILITVYRNLNKIKLGLSLLHTKQSSHVVENPLENIIQESNTVDIYVKNEDNENNERSSESIKSEKNDVIEVEKDIVLDADTHIENDLIIHPEENIEKQENDKKNYNKLISEYKIQLKKFEEDLEKDLLLIIDTAHNDYISEKYTKSSFANKYLNIGANFELKSDSKFYLLLNDFENELKENSYDTIIIKEVEKYYLSLKQQMKNDIINTMKLDTAFFIAPF